MSCGRCYTKNRISYHGEWMVRIPCQSHWSNYSSEWKLREILTLEMCIVINFLWIFLFSKHCIWLGLCEMVKNGCKVIYKVFDPTHLPNDQIFLERRLGFRLTLYYLVFIFPSLCSALCLQMIFCWGSIKFFKNLALHLTFSYWDLTPLLLLRISYLHTVSAGY